MPGARSKTGAARFRILQADPDADPPLYLWGTAPPHLKTRTQLRAESLRPGRQPIQGLVIWHGRRGRPTLSDGTRFAYLYDARLARPRLQVTAAHAAAAAKATASRRICPECGQDRGYQPAPALGHCNDCEGALAA